VKGCCFCVFKEKYEMKYLTFHLAIGSCMSLILTIFCHYLNRQYKGPKGVKIGCILDEEEAKYGLKLQTDVAITTPEYLPKLIRDGDVVPSKLRVIVYDEADLALEQTSDEDLNALFRDTESERDFSRLTYLVGASVTESLGKLCVKDSVLPEGKSFIATATRFAPLVAEDADLDNDTPKEKATFQDLGMCLDPGLRHERVIAPDNTGLVCLARMLRKELKDYENDMALGKNETMKIQRPKVVVFFPGEEEARAAIEPMRDAMWGEHKLCVLLPKSGVNPLNIMEQFKNGQTSVMLATPNSVRGLDFANLTHVYTLYLPVDDTREYLHLAGRVGRIGQIGSVAGKGGRVTSILRPDEAEQMVELVKELNFNFVDIEYETGEINPESSDVEEMRRYLEDKLTLISLAEDPVVDLDQAEKNRPSIQYENDDEDDEDEGETMDD
jgi:superfamily II DNA/RNA helicase